MKTRHQRCEKAGGNTVVTSAILLLAFNRPDTTKQVLEAIAQQRPAQLFVACDGPREGVAEDVALVAEVKKVIADGVTWECELHTRYPEENQGLKRGVVGAIDWFFDHVTEGIILEDDCLPHEDFFPYCDDLLERYRDDERIWAVQGDNSLKLHPVGDASYGFIPYALIWGWATWKRAWQHYDGNLDNWKKIRGTREVKKLWPDRIERRIRSKSLEFLLANPEDTWDHQWGFTVSYHRGLTVFPRNNLVSNIGWGRPDATHTKSSGSRQEAPTAPVLPLIHPEEVFIDEQATSDALNGRLYGAGKYRLRFQLQKNFRKLARAISAFIAGRTSER
jgi:hypothetical protein